MYLYTCVCVYIYIYIYVYTHRDNKQTGKQTTTQTKHYSGEPGAPAGPRTHRHPEAELRGGANSY